LPLFGGGNSPNRVPGVEMLTSAAQGDFDPAKDKYLDINAFAQPAPFTFGTLGRYDPNARGFAFFNEDFALLKRTHINETHNVEFRVEFFNAFNRVVFANPSASINSPQAFGRVTGQANVPRIIQFGLKYVF
jgi:hypothetical protein